jgi:hypothetical protein
MHALEDALGLENDRFIRRETVMHRTPAPEIHGSTRMQPAQHGTAWLENDVSRTKAGAQHGSFAEIQIARRAHICIDNPPGWDERPSAHDRVSALLWFRVEIELLTPYQQHFNSIEAPSYDFFFCPARLPFLAKRLQPGVEGFGKVLNPAIMARREQRICVVPPA